MFGWRHGGENHKLFLSNGTLTFPRFLDSRTNSSRGSNHHFCVWMMVAINVEIHVLVSPPVRRCPIYHDSYYECQEQRR